MELSSRMFRFTERQVHTTMHFDVCRCRHVRCTQCESVPQKLISCTLCRPSCSNCGDGGHTAGDCRREKPIAVRNERNPDRAAATAAGAQSSYYDDGYGDYGGHR